MDPRLLHSLRVRDTGQPQPRGVSERSAPRRPPLDTGLHALTRRGTAQNPRRGGRARLASVSGVVEQVWPPSPCPRPEDAFQGRFPSQGRADDVHEGDGFRLCGPDGPRALHLLPMSRCPPRTARTGTGVPVAGKAASTALALTRHVAAPCQGRRSI